MRFRELMEVLESTKWLVLALNLIYSGKFKVIIYKDDDISGPATDGMLVGPIT